MLELNCFLRHGRDSFLDVGDGASLKSLTFSSQVSRVGCSCGIFYSTCNLSLNSCGLLLCLIGGGRSLLLDLIGGSCGLLLSLISGSRGLLFSLIGGSRRLLLSLISGGRGLLLSLISGGRGLIGSLISGSCGFLASLIFEGIGIWDSRCTCSCSNSIRVSRNCWCGW